MNKENVRKFIEALRSGKYKQTKDKLRIGDCFCAYGLSCEVSGLGEWVIDPSISFMDTYFYKIDDTKYKLEPPDEVLAWLGARSGWEEATEVSNRYMMSVRNFHLVKNDYLLLRYDSKTPLKGLSTIAQQIWFANMRASGRTLLKSTITRAIFAPINYPDDIVSHIHALLDHRDVVHCTGIQTNHPQFIVYPYM